MPKYPDEIFAPRVKENKIGVVYDPLKKTIPFVEDVVGLDDEVVAIEMELGTNPKGAFASVAAFLAALLDSVISAFTDIPDVPASYVGQAGKVVKVKATEDGLEFGMVAVEGDMTKAVYDINNNGVVDNSEKLENLTVAQVRDHAPAAHGHAPAEVGLGNVTNNAQLKRAAADFASFTAKATPVAADLLLIEDSADGNAKKKVEVGSLPVGGIGWVSLGSLVWNNEGVDKTFNLPGVYDLIRMKYMLRNSGAVAGFLNMRFNGVSAANYSFVYHAPTVAASDSVVSFLLAHTSEFDPNRGFAIGEYTIAGKHNNGRKGIFGEGFNFSRSGRVLIRGELTGDNANLSSINILRDQPVTGKIVFYGLNL